jgi:tRNA threonylcarbamoyl adenosine modification protein YeaZ
VPVSDPHEPVVSCEQDGEVLAESATAGRSTAAQHLLDDVDHLMRTAAVEPSQLDAIVAGTGPGTFTGLRIGLASARALGFALSVPVHGVGTLDALLCGDGVDVACIDARRGEVFCKGAGIELCAIAPARLAELITPGASLAGDGAVRYRDLLEPAAVIACEPSWPNTRKRVTAAYTAACAGPRMAETSTIPSRCSAICTMLCMARGVVNRQNSAQGVGA